jgi:hypothetical protein
VNLKPALLKQVWEKKYGLIAPSTWLDRIEAGG